MRSAALLILLLSAACVRGRAVTTAPYSDAGRECRSAATLLGPGNGFSPSMVPPLWRVRACPTRAGELLALLLRESRSSADTGQLEARTWLTQYVHDANLLTAGLDVASDTTATPEARWAAFRVLLWSKAPGHQISLRDMLERPRCDPRKCSSSYTGHFYNGGYGVADTTSWPVFGVAMPTNYVAQIDSVARLVALDPATLSVVRRSAELVRLFPPDAQLKDR